MPESSLEFSPRRQELVLLGLALSLLLHGLLFLLVRRAAPPPWPEEAQSSLLFGVTFEVDTLPEAPEAGVAAPASTPDGPSEPGSAAAVPNSAQEPELKEDIEPREKAEPAEKTPGAPDAAPPHPSLKKPRATPNLEPKATEIPSRPKPDKTGGPNVPGNTQPVQEPSPGPGAYGQEGPARARASLYAAFVRTLPLAGKLLPGWLDAPLGQRLKVLVELRVDAAGHLQEIEVVRGDTKSLLARTALKNEAFLGRGSFAIRGEQAGQMLIELSSVVEDREPSGDEDASARVVALGQRTLESPLGRPPTGAYFTYGNGRHIEFESAVIELSR